jgi:hypothetical protein
MTSTVYLTTHASSTDVINLNSPETSHPAATNEPSSKKMTARWEIVNNKLVCKWLLVD